MDRRERVQTSGIEVEIAKLRLRIAAEKAEPARLLRQQVAQAPLASLGTALLAGLMLGRRSKAGSMPVDSAVGVGVVSELLALFTRATPEWRR